MPDINSPVQFPGESQEYRDARNQLLAEEMALRAKIEAVAEMRRALPAGGVAPEYEFAEASAESGRTVKLKDLFEDGKDTLLIYSYMFAPDADQPCPMCTCFLDGMDGYVSHLKQRVNLAVVARATAPKLDLWRKQRGWKNLRLLSSHDNNFNVDYHAEAPDGAQSPMMHVFTKQDGQVHHFWSSEMLYAPSEWHPRHVDMQWPVWHYFDITPAGRGDWFPQLNY